MKNNITWVTDASYIEVGQTIDTHNATLQSYLQNLQFFPNPLNKCFYQLPVEPDMPYLLRLWFAVGNYNGYAQSIRYYIETLDLLTMRNEMIDNTDHVLHDE